MRIALIGASGQLGTDLRKTFETFMRSSTPAFKTQSKTAGKLSTRTSMGSVIPNLVTPSKMAKKFNFEVINFDYPAFDLTKPAVIQRQLFKAKPDIIINTAAYNLVDRAEKFPQEALTVNYDGVKNLVAVVKKLNCVLIHFSTDYVFGADKNRFYPYAEDDLPAPINKYGQSKLLGEQFVRKNLKKYFLIRTSGLFGTAGSAGKGGNFIESIIRQTTNNLRLTTYDKQLTTYDLQLTTNKKIPRINVVDDQILTPTYTLDLAKQVWHLINSSIVPSFAKQSGAGSRQSSVEMSNYGLYHITSEGKCSWYEFAKEVFKILKQPVKIIPINSATLNLPAPRPAYSVLENKRLRDLGLNIMRPWQVTVADYLKEKEYIK